MKSSPTPVGACDRLAFITGNVEALLLQRGVIVTRNRYSFGLIAAGGILLIAIARIAHSYKRYVRTGRGCRLDLR